MAGVFVRTPRQGEPTADRVGGALQRDIEQAIGGLLFARAQMLVVTFGQTFAGSTRRIYTTTGTTTELIQIFGSGETLVPHGLGQPPRGWFVVGRTSSATPFEVVPSVATDPAQYLCLRSSSTAFYKLVAF